MHPLPMEPPPRRRILVIGAGFSGVLVAHELAEAGHTVTCIDQGDDVGYGSSNRSAACIRAQFSTEVNVRAMMYAIQYFEGLANILGEPVLRQNGYLYPFYAWHEAPWDEAKQHAQKMRRWGASEVEVVPATEAIERWPQLVPDNLLGCRFHQRDGFLRIASILSGLKQHARDNHGVVFRFRTKVTGLLVSGHQVSGVMTENGPIEADVVVNCTNAWTNHLLRDLKRSDGFQFPKIKPHRRYLAFLDTMGEIQGLETWPMIVHVEGHYCRPENSRDLMMGLAHRSKPEAKFPDSGKDADGQDERGAGFHEGAGLHYGQIMLTAMQTSLWPLAGADGRLRLTTGLYGISPDAQPIIDWDPDYDGLIHAVGFSGHGAMMSPATALVVKRLLDHTVGLPFDGSAFSLSRDFNKGENHVI